MARVEYLALDAQGFSATGVVRAHDEAEARQRLQRRRLTLVKLSAANDDLAQPPARRGRLPAAHLAVITRQLATLIAVSPLEEVLRILAVQEERPRIRAILSDVHAGVVEGQRLSEAMARQAAAFPPIYRAMVAAGEASGALPAILERLADLSERDAAQRSKLTAALVYPAALTLVAVSVTTALLIFVVPKVVDQFDTMGQTVPLLTRMVIGLADFLVAWGWLAAIVAAVAGVAAMRLLSLSGPRLAFDWRLLKLPIAGRLIRAQNGARLARTLAAVTACGAPLHEGLVLAAPTVRNRALRAATEDLAASVREGGSLSAAMKRAGVFPPVLVHMTASGEQAGQLEPMLEGAATYLERDVAGFTTVALSLLEPAIIVLMGLVVGTIVLSILLPILAIDTLTLR